MKRSKEKYTWFVLLAAGVFTYYLLKANFKSDQETEPLADYDEDIHVNSYHFDVRDLSEDWRRLQSHYDHDTAFKIIILTQRRHLSLERLLKSLEAALYLNNRVNLEIRIDFDLSDDHIKTVQLANNFKFTHGPKHVHVYNKTQGLPNAWFNSWNPTSVKERAIILEDDMKVSPLWFVWIQRAWYEYGDLTELGAISLCRQRLNASNGERVQFESESPFLYRLFGTHGFSPNARYWRDFVEWARSMDVENTDFRVNGSVTSAWWENKVGMWLQYWIWWCSKDQQLYTLYVHSRNGALVSHWQEPGGHSTSKRSLPSDKVLLQMEPVLETFPWALDHYGWNFKLEPYHTANASVT